MDVPVSFGTSGHRGVVGDAFTVAHVAAIAVGVAQWLRHAGAPLSVAIGYDSRNGNDPALTRGSFTHILVETLLNHGISVWFATAPTPTPVMSWVVTHYRLGGALILTASHNPPQYNGLKFNPPNGAPASVAVTSFIENMANAHLKTPTASPYSRAELLLRADFPSVFAEGLYTLISDFLGRFDWSGSRILIDAAHGAVAQTWEAVFTRFGIREHAILCAEPKPDFGGLEPNPTHAKAFGRLQSVMDEQRSWGRSWDMAIGNDPDGDRHIVLDELGVPLTPEETAVLILEMLLSVGKRPHAVASTLASSSLVRRACETHGIPYVETAVGFKYFAPVFEAADAAGGFAMGVESSGGFSISRHTYEKCGFLPLVLAYYGATSGKPLSVLRQALRRYGTFVFAESSFSFAPEKKSALLHFLATVDDAALGVFSSTADGDEGPKVDRRDGLKVSLPSGAWVLVRLSGTEPIGRLYAESSTSAETQRLMAVMQDVLASVI